MEKGDIYRAFMIALIRGRLAVPIPTTYETWFALHCELEILENGDGDGLNER